jgi:hypothetical protein
MVFLGNRRQPLDQSLHRRLQMRAICCRLRSGPRRFSLLSEYLGGSLLEPASGSLMQRHDTRVRAIQNAPPLLASVFQRDLLLLLAIDDCGLRGAFCFENSIHRLRNPSVVPNRIIPRLRRNTHRSHHPLRERAVDM